MLKNKKNILIILFTLIGIAKHYSQTTISTGTVNGIWTQANSPYLITGNISVPNGSTLTIQPGVTVTFQGNYKLTILGQILAVGNQNDSIKFNAANTSIGWLGIKFINTSSSNDTSRFSYCDFKYGNTTSQTFPDNRGGIFRFVSFSKAVISNSTFSNCSAGEGGAIMCEGCSIKILKNVFSNNTAETNGVISCLGASPSYQSIISGNLFINNTATLFGNAGGGAIGVSDYSIICNNTFIGNKSSGINGICAGAIYCANGSNTKIYNNKISNNQSINGGSGAIGSQGNGLEIFNNLIVNNEAQGGGAISCIGGKIYNNTIANNKVGYNGAALTLSSSSATITNCIIWGNIGIDNIFLTTEYNCDPNFHYCDINGGQASIGYPSGATYTGTYTNNINQDPQFINPSSGAGVLFDGLLNTNWALNNNSPCIDAGNPTMMYPSFDIDQNTRVVNGRIDIGAYEQPLITNLRYRTETIMDLYPNPSNGNFTILLNTKEKQLIQLFDITGNVVLSQTIENGKAIIDGSNLAAGIYNINTKGSNSIANKKLVIVK